MNLLVKDMYTLSILYDEPSTHLPPFTLPYTSLANKGNTCIFGTYLARLNPKFTKTSSSIFLKLPCPIDNFDMFHWIEKYRDGRVTGGKRLAEGELHICVREPLVASDTGLVFKAQDLHNY